MGERRALVIGAQNDRFGNLDFVDRVARDLHAAVMDEQFGACRPAVAGNNGLLLGGAANCAGIKEGLREAMESAALDQATLFIYFIGHGHQVDQDFFLVANDTPGSSVDSDTAIHVGQRVKELLRHNAAIDGLMLVLDACHSGAAVADPVPGLLQAGILARMEVLAATRRDETTSNGCFSRSITRLLTRGSASTADEYLRAYDEYARLQQAAPPGCQDMPTPVHVSLSGGTDAGLWLGRNPLADVRPSLAHTGSAADIARLTRRLVTTSSLRSLMSLLLGGSSLIAVTGGPGTGKSTLLAALGRNRIAGVAGTDVLVTARPGDTLATIVAGLGTQLSASGSYRQGQTLWARRTPVREQAKAPTADRILAGPLAHLASGDKITIAIDGIDQLGTLDRRRLLEALGGHPGVTVVVAGREVAETDGVASVVLPDRDPEAVRTLLAGLPADENTRTRLAEACGGDWLLARVLEGLSKAEALPATGQPDLEEALEMAVRRARELAPAAPVDAVLAGLAAVPSGASMPFTLFMDVISCADDTRHNQAAVRDALVALGEMVARADPGSSDEWIGPAHDLIASFLTSRVSSGDLEQVHLRFAQAAKILSGLDPSPRTLAYITHHLSDHLWHAGMKAEALSAVPKLDTPADNLAIWQLWEKRIAESAPDDPILLEVRNRVATWTGQSGNGQGARELFADLLPDVIKVHGVHHPMTYGIRGNLALWTGRMGSQAEAREQFEDLLRDQSEHLARDHPDLLKTRGNLATWTGEAGDPRTALEMSTALLADQQRILGPRHLNTFNTRLQVIMWTGRLGNAEEALAAGRELLADQEAAFGPDHTDTLVTRSVIADLAAQAGDRDCALRESADLLRAQLQVLGASHPDVLATKTNIATWTGESGDIGTALSATRELLIARRRLLGALHPATLQAHNNVAVWIGRSGNRQGALRILGKVLAAQERALGREHPDVLDTRGNIALQTAHSGDTAAAVQGLTALLADQERLLGATHPRTAETRANIRAILSGEPVDVPAGPPARVPEG